MQANFRITNPNILAEAKVGDLFVPLGPDLVECVCALRCSQYSDGFHADMSAAARLNPDAARDIVVVACRVGPGEPEYYPPGFWNKLSGAAPIAFLQQCEALQLQPRTEQLPWPPGWFDGKKPAEAPRTPPLYADLDAMGRDMRERIDGNLPANLARAVVQTVVDAHFARPELASKL